MVARREAANMTYSPEGYRKRAEECAKLANSTADQMIQMELLKLRQTYLQIASTLESYAPETDHGFITRH